MPQIETREDHRDLNNLFFEQLQSSGPVVAKQAEDISTDFIRMKVREMSFWRKLLPVIPVSNSDLVPQVDTDQPMMIVEREPASMGSVVVGFGTMPDNYYIMGDKVRAQFARLLTPRYTKDSTELRTYRMDIRQVMSDNTLKDLLGAEDAAWQGTIDTILGSANSTVLMTGTVQYRQLYGGITRANLFEMRKTISMTPSGLSAHTGLVNNVTIHDFAKPGRDSQGGDLAETIMKNGFSEQRYAELDWIVTIKKNLVPNGHVYMFSDPAFIGKFYELEQPTMYIKKDAFMLEYFTYEEIGGTIGNAAGLAHVQFM